MYLTISCLRKNLERLTRQYANLIVKSEWKKWYVRFVRLLKEKFLFQESEGSLEASQILDDVTPEMVSAAVMSFIDECPEIK